MLKVIGKGQVVFERSQSQVPYVNTGKVKIGCAYIRPPQPIRGDYELNLQGVLLAK